MRIVLATNGSPSSEAAVGEVLRRPWPEGTEVVVVSVADLSLVHLVEPWFTAPEDHKSLRNSLVQQATASIMSAVERLETGSEGRLKISYELLHGNPKKAIVVAAERLGADLIVIGSHSDSTIDRLLLGSVTAAVASHASCSVEIVRPRESAATT